MWKIRFAQPKDLFDLTQIGSEVGPGMSSFPESVGGWRKRLDETLQSITYPSTIATYFMIMKGLHSSEVIGTSAVYSGLGFYRSYHSFSKEKNKLVIDENFTGATEFGSLYVSYTQRGLGLGKILSYSRFVLLKAFPELFSKELISVCRGDSHGDICPFWEEVGATCYPDIPFSSASVIVGSRGTSWLVNQFPKYVRITDKIKPLLGVVNEDSAGAYALLKKQGFVTTSKFDLLDGGPILHARVNTLPIMDEIKKVKIEFDRNFFNSDYYIVAQGELANFQMLVLPGNLKDDTLYIPAEFAKYLQQDLSAWSLRVGDL